ncbi:MAG: glutamate--tRNA ligase [SAR202 cluster bacterium]|nr:glutamate--tRNA ligase [SAR202 cluster bacterium]
MSRPVRVRYAPSPTGEPHIGNIRSALFNWLFARANGGKFLVRIEDTDQARLVPGAQEKILEGLRWLSLDWNEGPEVGGPHCPYVQSERKALGIYAKHVELLIDSGAAYRCYCTSQRLDQMRADQQARKQPPGYDRRCRDLTAEQRRQRATENPNPAVRFKMPLSGEIAVEDAIRGTVRFDAALLDDFVLLKSDGFPTYHLANVVDDHLMEISHVMRAEEWLSSAPRHKELYKAFGFEMPVMAHLPIILGPDRSKLSKRHGATSILEYRDQGYLPDAMLNFMALLGWSLDDSTELFSRADLIKHFSLDRVTASPAVFNIEKLNWFNGVYIRMMQATELADVLLPIIEEKLPPEAPRPIDRDYLLRIIPLERERLKTLNDAPELLSFFFVEQPKYNPITIIQKGMVRDDTREALTRALRVAEHTEPWDAPTLEAAYRNLAEELELKPGQLFGAMRVALTGRTEAPPLFDTMVVLGKERCVARLKSADYFMKIIPTAC